MNHFLSGCFALVVLSACQNGHTMTATQRTAEKDSVTAMMTLISRDITNGGPTQWLEWYEDDPGFYMSSDGEVKFSDYPSAVAYTRDSLPRMMSHITLAWSHLHIDPLTPEFAAIGADFKEDVTLTGGQAITFSGFFNALAHFNGATWRIRNMNWAILHK
jgi:hypothetical protein